MPRIEAIKHRLDNWARWMLGSSVALGYPKRSSFLRVAPAAARDRDSAIPIDDVEAGVTHQAVESLRMTKSQSHLFQVLQLVYLRDMTAAQAGRAMGKGASTIALYLAQADAAIAHWLTERSRSARGVQG